MLKNRCEREDLLERETTAKSVSTNCSTRMHVVVTKNLKIKFTIEKPHKERSLQLPKHGTKRHTWHSSASPTLMEQTPTKWP